MDPTHHPDDVLATLSALTGAAVHSLPVSFLNVFVHAANPVLLPAIPDAVEVVRSYKPQPPVVELADFLLRTAAYSSYIVPAHLPSVIKLVRGCLVQWPQPTPAQASHMIRAVSRCFSNQLPYETQLEACQLLRAVAVDIGDVQLLHNGAIFATGLLLFDLAADFLNSAEAVPWLCDNLGERMVSFALVSATLARDSGMELRAIDILQTTLATQQVCKPEHLVRVRRLLSTVFFCCGRLDDALDQLSENIQAGTTDYLGLANIEFYRGNIQMAFLLYRQAGASVPMHIGTANCYLSSQQPRPQLALQHLDIAAKKLGAGTSRIHDCQMALIYVTRARANRALGQPVKPATLLWALNTMTRYHGPNSLAVVEVLAEMGVSCLDANAAAEARVIAERIRQRTQAKILPHDAAVQRALVATHQM